MASVVALTVVVLLVCGALKYIVKEKKKGVKCIGCPDSGSCSHCGQNESHNN